MTLRLLVAEAGKDQASVWGWAEGPGTGGVDVEGSWLAGICERTLSEAEEMARDLLDSWILPDRLLVGLPASQLRGRAWTVNLRRARPDQPIEERELQGLLSRTLRLVVNRLLGMEDEGPSWLLIDAAPVSFSVDDHGVTDPVGFRGREVSATVFAALARTELVQLWGRIAQHLEFSALILAAAPLALAAGLTVSQGMLFDIGGVTTDLVWCRAGRPVALDSLPMGGTAISQALTRKWGLSFDRAERLKRAYTGGRLADEAKLQVLEAMSPALQAWLQETEKALSRLNQDQPLPERLFLLGGASALPEMAEAVGALAWSQRLRFARYPQVSRLQPGDVPGVVNRTGLGRGVGDVPALALAAWAVQQQRPLERPMAIIRDLCHEMQPA